MISQQHESYLCLLYENMLFVSGIHGLSYNGINGQMVITSKQWNMDSVLQWL